MKVNELCVTSHPSLTMRQMQLMQASMMNPAMMAGHRGVHPIHTLVYRNQLLITCFNYLEPALIKSFNYLKYVFFRCST